MPDLQNRAIAAIPDEYDDEHVKTIQYKLDVVVMVHPNQPPMIFTRDVPEWNHLEPADMPAHDRFMILENY